MKKNYMKPTMRVVKMQHRQHIGLLEEPKNAENLPLPLLRACQ